MKLTLRPDKEITENTKPTDLFPPQQAHALEQGTRAMAAVATVQGSCWGMASLWGALSTLGTSVLLFSLFRPRFSWWGYGYRGTSPSPR